MSINSTEIGPVIVENDILNTEDIENINIDKDNFFTSEDVPKDIRFDTLDEVENYFDEYGSRNGFDIVKYRMERNSKSQVHKRTFVCKFSGKYKSKKKIEATLKGIQKNTKTKKLSCPWHINLSFPKHSTKIIITTFINQHNHALVPKTQEFATKYRSFTDEALKEISLMTKHGNLTLTAQRNLLKARFQNLHFQDQDLANAIQKYKNVNKINNDASTLLTSLMQKKIEDLRWVVDFELDKENQATLKGIQRNTKTKKLSCPWHINLSFPEHSTKIIVTTFINQHNHALVPKTQEFATKYRSFTDEALKEISLMTKHGNLTLTAQRNLLKARFQNLHFQDQDLANAIQKYKNVNKINNDASTLLTSLMQKKIEDLRWVVDFELDKENRLTRLFWMSPDQVDL
ncbi:hypothetical protein Glove_245g26 [Diversispora epigaea]|uniref:FAR1 domain-containing protein n=1 Tax=Diversispora epigaea TaxID=1348612 RepID=A0A397IBD9_9GLOM|nr:hypothetical protein Glove_245g26 [Diversispora epigaea]